MKMMFFVIVFAAFAIGAECRSLTLSNTEKESSACIEVRRGARVHRDTSNQDASPSNQIESIASRNSLNLTGKKIPINTSEQLKELIASYEENFEKLMNFTIKMSEKKDKDKQEIQLLKQLSSVIEQLVQEQSRVRDMHGKLDNDTDSTLQALSNNPTVKNINNVKDLINTMKEIDIIYQDGELTDEHIRIKRAAEGRKRAAAAFATSEERMTGMLLIDILIDIQRQMVQIRKYLDKLCKKHHPTSTTILEVNPNDAIFPVGQPNEVAIM